MSTATDMLALYLDAEKKILGGQSVRFGDRMLTRADLAEIRKGRQEWEQKVSQETRQAASSSGPRYMSANFSDA